MANTSANEEITQRNEPGTEASNIPEATYSENIVESDSTPRAKKRKRNECGWKKNVVKKLRNTGKSYKSTATKKIVPERKMKQPCNEKCKLGCSTKFTEMDRKKLFDEYWQLGDVQKHWTYLSNCMTVIKPKYRYVREGGTRNKREYNNAFSFNLHDEKVRVCKLFFKNTLGITDRPIRTVMFKRNKVAGTILAPDYRGKHSNHPKVDESIRSAIKAHIESIPKIESHYTRANTSKEFIDGSRSIAEIHKDYVDICKSKNVPYGNYMLFYKIFTEEFNISFFKPKKDRCDTCVIYENCENEDKESRKEDYDRHLIEKDICRAEKAKDKENDLVITAVYDLQAVFQCPKGDTSLFYYVSKLNVFNFTIFELRSKKVDCYIWDEATGNRGVNDLGTCVFKYIQNLASNGDDIEIIFYSDNCVGQQKNKMMLSMYMFAIRSYPNIKAITHKYLIKGHTQNEGDSAHSLIERQVKKQVRGGPMYTPEAFISAVKTARTKPEPFKVNMMSHEDFLDWKDVCAQMGFNVVRDENGDSIKFTDLKVVKFKKDHPNIMFFKTSYRDVDFKRAEVIKKKRNFEIHIKKAYNQRPGLSKKKKDDLLGLLNKKAIPSFYAPFYNSL